MVPKNTEKGALGISIIQLCAENQNYQRGDSLATSQNFENAFHNAKKLVKPNLLSCLITTAALKTMVAKGGSSIW